MMPLPIALVAHDHHVVEVGIVEFRAFYYLLQGKIAVCCKNILWNYVKSLTRSIPLCGCCSE